MLKKRLIILIAAVACMAVAAVALAVTMIPRPAPAPAPAPANEPTPEPANEKTWRLFDNVWGQGDYTTSVFRINHPWRVNWNYSSTTTFQGGVFGVMAYAKFEIEWHAIAIDGSTISNTTSGVLNVNQTGAFYLSVIANDWVSWHLGIEEYS